MQVECSHLRTLWPKPGAEESDYIIAVYKPLPGGDVKDEFVAKGNSLPTDPYLDITFQGKFVLDEKRGSAFVVKSYVATVKRTRANVLGYLSSGLIKGVGPEIAKRIVDVFGVEAIDVLEKNPERLREVSGIGEKTLAQMMESLYENREIHSIMKYLGQYDISINKARRIVKKYGDKSLEVIRNDIYHLCEVDGFGFTTVDTMAQKMNHPMNTLPRVKAAAEYVLKENRSQGHLYMEPDDFLKVLKKSLNHKDASYKFTETDLRPLANEALETDKIKYNNRCIYLTRDYINEKGFAEIMAGRLYTERHKSCQPFACPNVSGSGIRLSEEQEKAVIMALSRNTCIITGGPGTGKTTVLKTFLEFYAKTNKGCDGILLCAPTGRAARKMSEATGYQASTIHKAFCLGSEDDTVPDTKKHYDLVVIDEVSMADMWISYQVLAAINDSTKLVFVGDAAQLPSVGPGNVLYELIQSGLIPTVQLKQVFRQAQGSSIAENAKRISEASANLIYDDDFIFVPSENQKQAMSFVCKLYQKAVAALGVEKVQVLTPVRKRGECGANNLNTEIQKMIQGDPEKGRKVFDRYFCEGDPVIQTKNEGGVNNGDLGTITEVSNKSVKVQFLGLDGLREYDEDGLRILDLAYSCTVHKSQGNEYPIVIFPILREHTFMLNRNLFYTAVTRGKSRVILVGNQWAVREAIRKVDTLKRRTCLAMRISAKLGQLEGENTCETEMDLRKSA